MLQRSSLAGLVDLSPGVVGCLGGTAPVPGGRAVVRAATLDAPAATATSGATDGPSGAGVPTTDAPVELGRPSWSCAPPPPRCACTPSTALWSCAPLLRGPQHCEPACGGGSCDVDGAAPGCAPFPFDEGRTCARAYRGARHVGVSEGAAC